MDSKAIIGLAILGGGALVLLAKEGIRTGTTVPPKAPPPYTLSPQGRYLTDFEKYVLNTLPYAFPFKGSLNSARLWFERPQSALVQTNDAEQHVTTQALTTKDGIFFPLPNHEFATAKEFALLAHELIHWYQFSSGNMSRDPAENELPAYQAQIAAKEYLDEFMGQIADAWAVQHPGWVLA